MSNSPKPRPSSSAKVRNAQAAASGGSRIWWVAGAGALVIIALLVIAIVATRSSNDAATSTAGQLAFGTVTVTGENLPEQPADANGQPIGADPAIGKTAPTVTGQRFDGSAITIPSSGKPKVVMLVAHWCPHCQKEVPLIAAELNSKGLPTDVDLFTVATGTSDQRPNYPPAAWLASEKWPVQTLVDDQDSTAAQAYGLSGYPTFVVIDANGKVVDRQSGEKSIDQFNAMLQEARTGTKTAA